MLMVSLSMRHTKSLESFNSQPCLPIPASNININNIKSWVSMESSEPPSFYSSHHTKYPECYKKAHKLNGTKTSYVPLLRLFMVTIQPTMFLHIDPPPFPLLSWLLLP